MSWHKELHFIFYYFFQWKDFGIENFPFDAENIFRFIRKFFLLDFSWNAIYNFMKLSHQKYLLLHWEFPLMWNLYRKKKNYSSNITTSIENIHHVINVTPHKLHHIISLLVFLHKNQNVLFLVDNNRAICKVN